MKMCKTFGKVSVKIVKTHAPDFDVSDCNF